MKQQFIKLSSLLFIFLVYLQHMYISIKNMMTTTTKRRPRAPRMTYITPAWSQILSGNVDPFIITCTS